MKYYWRQVLPLRRGPHEGNKRQTLVGDAVIRLVMLDGWYEDGTSTGSVSWSISKGYCLKETEEGSRLISEVGSNKPQTTWET